MRLAHRFDGPRDAPVLVLSNSLGTTTELWDLQVPDLAERFRVLRYDHPGHGESEFDPGPFTVDGLAEGVLELLDELGIEQISFCGLSLGGMVGMSLAVQAPERVERLALCCTAAYLGPPDGWAERARLVRTEGMEPIVEAVLARWFTPAFSDAAPDTVVRFRETLSSISRDGYAACCDAIGEWDARSDIHAITAPTLVIVGEEDPVIGPDHVQEITRAVQGASVARIPNTAHLANVERPDAFTAAVLAHLVTEVTA